MSTDDKTQIVFAYGVQAGTQLNGIYEIDEKIAAGGMGEVYRGHNIQTGDPVAIKIVLPDFARDPTILALFRKEASVLNHLAHNAIVRYYVFSIDPGIGRPYLAMEFVDGKSLAEAMQEGPLTTTDACLLVARIASGLAAAHEAGVVHRDLSPDNIILSGGSVAKAKIIDFGIARSETIGGGTLLGGRFAGKYNFVSPEQLGLFGGDVTERSDIYSLGLVFAAALRGEPLDMSGSQVDVVEKRRVVPPLERVPEAMRPLVEAMLQPDPADRPASMELIAEWLTPAQTLQQAAAAAEPRAAMPTASSLPPSDRTVLTTPPAMQRPSTGGPIGARSAPFAAPGADPFANPFSGDGSSARSARPFETGSFDPPHPTAEEPYRYIPSNPEFLDDPHARPPSDERSGGDREDRRPGSSRAGRRLAVPAGAVSLLLLAAAGAAYFGGAFSGSGPDAVVDAVPPAQTAATAPSPGTETAAVVPRQPPADADAVRPTVRPPPEAGGTPPPAEVPVAPPEDRFAGIGSAVEWLKNYDGGPCFFAHPLQVSESSMSIEGFGQSIDPFRTMDTAFKDANGYEPNIGVRQITASQCGLAEFMRQVERGGGPMPELELSDDQIRSGESLQGVIGGLADRSVSLWLIDDQGIVYDLNQHLKRVEDRASFNIKLVDLKTGIPVPQLIFAVSSETPLVSLSHSEPKRLPSFLTGVRAEITRDDKAIGVAAKYFELGG